MSTSPIFLAYSQQNPLISKYKAHNPVNINTKTSQTGCTGEKISTIFHPTYLRYYQHAGSTFNLEPQHKPIQTLVMGQFDCDTTGGGAEFMTGTGQIYLLGAVNQILSETPPIDTYSDYPEQPLQYTTQFGTHDSQYPATAMSYSITGEEGVGTTISPGQLHSGDMQPNHSDDTMSSPTEGPSASYGTTGYYCGVSCVGYFIGEHLCHRQWQSLTIYCVRCRAVFGNRTVFNRHYSSCHNHALLFCCSFPGCHRIGNDGFTRSDNLLQHRRKVHGETLKKFKVRLNGRKRPAKGNAAGRPEVSGPQYTTSVVEESAEE